MFFLRHTVVSGEIQLRRSADV